MKLITYSVGFIIGAFIVYLVGSFVAWDLNIGHWSAFWRIWCLVWVFIWGHFGGIFVKESFDQ